MRSFIEKEIGEDESIWTLGNGKNQRKIPMIFSCIRWTMVLRILQRFEHFEKDSLVSVLQEMKEECLTLMRLNCWGGLKRNQVNENEDLKGKDEIKKSIGCIYQGWDEACVLRLMCYSWQCLGNWLHIIRRFALVGFVKKIAWSKGMVGWWTMTPGRTPWSFGKAVDVCEQYWENWGKCKQGLITWVGLIKKYVK